MGFVISKTKNREPLPKGWKWAEIKPGFWFEWGDEPRGMVSTGVYDEWGNYYYTGLMPISVKQSLNFHNPFS